MALVTALVLTGCSPDTGSGEEATQITQAEIDEALNTPTEITFWAKADFQAEVDAFEEKYPAITVNFENTAAEHYRKINTVIQAGNGAPDVVQMEYQYIPTYTQTSSLLDLGPFLAEDLEPEFVPWVWSQVTSGTESVWALPGDSGPMGNVYRNDILAAAGVDTPPATWAEYAEAAAVVKETTGSYISNLAANQAGQFIALMWQKGIKPFGFDGAEAVTVDVNGPEAKELAAYWQELVQADLISVDPDFTDGWYQGLANGKYAGWLTAAWAPVFMQGTAGDTSGLWTAAPLPQWEEGQNVSSNWGGSAYSVMAESENPIVAAQLVKWLTATDDVALQLSLDRFLFPTKFSVLEDTTWSEQELEFFGGQQVNGVFGEISTTVDTEFDWVPYMDVVYSTFTETIGKAIADKSDFAAGLDAWQAALVEYGTQQGFTVNGG
ncbi:ABC transporter substrate-binding protein [Microcella sp.]|uniref:ABC transporter substrate-binding protein n=1 Tax=Microcella sp. TaxID=1913979 RepID=UPI003F71C9F5